MGEDLYAEMQRDEEEAANLYKFQRPPAPRRLPDTTAARERYNREIAPVIARIKRAQAGQPITRNPLRNLWLKMTGQDVVPTPEAIDPRPGIAVQHGITSEEMRAEIVAHPELYPDLAKPPVVKEKK